MTASNLAFIHARTKHCAEIVTWLDAAHVHEHLGHRQRALQLLKQGLGEARFVAASIADEDARDALTRGPAWSQRGLSKGTPPPALSRDQPEPSDCPRIARDQKDGPCAAGWTG